MERRDRKRKTPELSEEDQIRALYLARKEAARRRGRKFRYGGSRVGSTYEWFYKTAQEFGRPVQEIKRIVGAYTHDEIMEPDHQGFCHCGNFYILDGWGNAVWRVQSDDSYMVSEFDKRYPIDAPHSVVAIADYKAPAEAPKPLRRPAHRPWWIRFATNTGTFPISIP